MTAQPSTLSLDLSGVQGFLAPLMDSGYVTTALLLAQDGSIITALPERAHRTGHHAQRALIGLGALETLGEKLALGSLHKGIIEYQEGFLIGAPLAAGYSLVLFLETNANLGMLLSLLNRTIPTWGDLLTPPESEA